MTAEPVIRRFYWPCSFLKVYRLLFENKNLTVKLKRQNKESPTSTRKSLTEKSLFLKPEVYHMFSKEEAKKIKAEFWTAFGKSFPQKWLLYNTRIKGFSFKFFADNKKAEVALELEMTDLVRRNAYYNKIWSLEDILQDYIGHFAKEEFYVLENGKTISRIWVTLEHVSVFNKKNWSEIFEFFQQKMNAFEEFFWEYEDFIRDVPIEE